MENSRRPYDRSLPKEPGPKKPRLAEALNAPDRSSNGRSGFIQRPAASNSGGGGSSFQRDRDSESSDSVRGPFPHQPGQQLHQELVTQYKTALAELTFNSKPIITNLTIIAGENLHAAKAIADTVCANILEVTSEQKLPSLYLLDSIVKNIGRDYIKSFAARLPEVFCKAYRQVDPSIHQGMRHLFGTWKGVFPPQSLQMIEKELGFTASVNGSSQGTITSKPDSQSQRPAHSIHVNPKYLEARKHLQPTRARGAGSDISGALANSVEDAESLERTSSVNSGRSWTDTYAKHQHRDLVNEPVRDKNTSVPYVDPEYGSNVSERSGFGTGRVSETSKEQGFDRPWYESGSDVTGKVSTQKHGFDRTATHKSSNSNSHLQHKKNFTPRSTNGMSRSWKNSEEEEYIWDEMNSRPTDHGAVETLAQDHRMADNYERLDIGSHLKRPQGVRDIGPRVDDKASADSISTELGKVTSGDQMPTSWPQELHPPEGKILGGPGKKISGYSVGYTSGSGSSASIVVREPFQPQHGPSHIEASIYGPKVSLTQKPQNSGAGSSTTHSFMHQLPPSPSFSASNSNPLLRNISELNQTSIGAPTDPRKPPGLRNMGSHDQFSRDPLPLPSRDVYQTSIQRSQPQNLRTTSAVIPPLQQRKHVVSTQQRNLEVSEFDSSGGQNSFLPQISGSESLSSMVNSSSDKSNIRTDNFPGSGQSLTSSLLAAVVQSGILDRSSLTGSLTIPNSQEAGLGPSLGDVQPPLSSGLHPTIFSPSQPLHGNTGHLAFPQKNVEHPPLPPGPPPSFLVGIHPEQTLNAAKSTSNPVSSLLSSLVAKGLISSSKSDTASSTSLKVSDQPQDRGPGVASTSSTPVSSVPVLMTKALLSNTDEPSSFKSAAKVSDDLPRSTTKIKNLIGFEFRPDVVRNLHPDVVRDLSDLPHQCSVCGLRLKLQERLDRHMEWHALRDSKQNPCNMTSRRWYAESVDWVAGIGHFDPSDSAMCEVSETSEQMVPADESQCACILCGELFEDFYSQERGEWMFKGAVYLTVPSSDSHERTGTMSDNAFLSPIVHSNCISEDSVCDLGLACDIKLENDA